MGPSQRRITTALTWPLLLAYRYRTGGKERAS
jgi:hypothetical protein